MSTSKNSSRPAPARTALESIAADITQRVRETREKITELEKSRAALAALIDSRIKNGALYGASYPAEAREVDRAELSRRDKELEDLVQMAGVLQLELRRLDRELALVGMTEHVTELENINTKVGPLGVDLIKSWNHMLETIVDLVELNETHQRTRARHKQDAEDFEREYGEPCAMLPGGTIPQDAALAMDVFEFWDHAREIFKGLPSPDITRKASLNLAEYTLLRVYDAKQKQSADAPAERASEEAADVAAPAEAVPTE